MYETRYSCTKIGVHVLNLVFSYKIRCSGTKLGVHVPN